MEQAPINSGYNAMGGNTGVTIGYRRRQCGCLWILLLLAGISQVVNFLLPIFVDYDNMDTDTNDDTNINDEDASNAKMQRINRSNIIQGIILICWAIATIWTQIEDRGNHLLLTYGPCRWLLCGMGKEKIAYDKIRDYQISKSCFYGFGLPCCTSIKLFNTCSCCCGELGKCCGHKTIKLTIKERPQGEDATDNDNCCMENCCLNCWCGERGEYIGKGCCFDVCCNPCDANCCMVNTIFVSTNDADGVLRLLNEKVGASADGDLYATI
eukprot:112081_1